MAGERLLKIMQEAAKGVNPETEKANILWGTVISTNPLKVSVDSRFEIGEEFLTLSPFCKECSITIPGHEHKIGEAKTGLPEPSEAETDEEIPKHTHTVEKQEASPAESVKITLWRGLAAGDTVLMLRYANGNSYYVLQRDGGL